MERSGANLERGRRACAERAWAEAGEALSAAELEAPLGGEDLERLSTALYMAGDDDAYRDALERGYRAHLDAGADLLAARCAFWIGITLARAGEMGRAGGWLGRAQRLIDRADAEVVEHGYMLFPAVFEMEGSGSLEEAAELAGRAAELGERFGDLDLFALAIHEQGHVLIKLGRVQDGLRLLDEAMVAASADELSPIVTGLVYCGVIEGCQEVYELRRAREWTEVLSEWCAEQPDLVAFTGRCLVHRAEVMQLNGAWADALTEARRAGRRAEGTNRLAAGDAHYREGELHRLRGDLAAAEDAYKRASRCGREPQPGLALTRLAQGTVNAARASIRRVLDETQEPLARAGLLPACVEIELAAGDIEGARRSSEELTEISAGYESPSLRALEAGARGTIGLASDDPRAALGALREATSIWQELAAPYEEARARALLGAACRDLGDEDAAALEREAARATFEELGAALDLAALDGGSPKLHGLTPRELEVLGHLAAGRTNKGIAAELVLSERTVDRHVSNIFAKLGVSSRAAATAYAYEHDLIRPG